ncbi:MAG: PIN domain-containing protein [Chloroflexi bacterium]|nr:PIN domain-containing protein [Chloroflexota bacterium]
MDAGERLLLSPVVVLETLSVLQYSDLFGLDPKQAADALLTLVQAEEVECEEHECVTAALERQAAGEGLFTDAFLVCRAQQESVRLLTNDRRLAEAAGRKAVYLRHLAGG